MISAVAIALVALAQAETTWAAEVRVGGRVRTPTVTAGVTDVPLDLELAPRVGGALSGGGYRLAVDYGATLRARQPQNAFHLEHSHLATLQAGWRREGRARPFLFVVGNYGVVDLTNLAAPQAAPTLGANQTAPTPDPADPTAPTPQPQPAATTPQAMLDAIPRLDSLFAYGIDASFGVEVPLSPLVSWTTSAGYFHGGGANADSMVTLPVQNAPRVSTRLDWGPTRRDNFEITADARNAWFSTGGEAGDAELSVGWRRHLSEPMTLELRAGAGGAANREPPSIGDASPGRVFRLLPTGQLAWAAGLKPHPQWSLNLWLSAGAGPFVDRFRALAYERVEGQGGFEVGLRDWVSLRCGGGASVALGAEAQIGHVVSTWLNGSLAVHPQQWWRLDLSATHSFVTTDLVLQDGSPTPPVTQWVIGLGLTVLGQGSI